jgi:hypothetical protein
VGVVVPESVIPMTITIKIAARTTVIATIKMVAMTGDTPSESFLAFQIFFIIKSSITSMVDLNIELFVFNSYLTSAKTA